MIDQNETRSLLPLLIMSSIFGKIDVETPQYNVVSSNELYEIREYGPTIRAETSMNTTDITSGDGFRTLASYIFGGNKPREISSAAKDDATSAEAASSVSIPMTAPVVTVQEDYEKTTMAFILPSQYNEVKDLPVPNNSEVRLVQVPSQTFAVHKFSGTVSKETVKEKESELKKALDQNGVLYDKESNAVLWRYNPPWCLPWYRTNEVAILLQKQKEEK